MTIHSVSCYSFILYSFSHVVVNKKQYHHITVMVLLNQSIIRTEYSN